MLSKGEHLNLVRVFVGIFFLRKIEKLVMVLAACVDPSRREKGPLGSACCRSPPAQRFLLPSWRSSLLEIWKQEGDQKLDNSQTEPIAKAIH